MPLVKNRKLVFVRFALNSAGINTYQIDVPFFVHDMIVRSWSLKEETIRECILHMQGVGDLFSFVGQEHGTPKHIFNINRSMQGLQTFQLVTITPATERIPTEPLDLVGNPGAQPPVPPDKDWSDLVETPPANPALYTAIEFDNLPKLYFCLEFIEFYA